MFYTANYIRIFDITITLIILYIGHQFTQENNICVTSVPKLGKCGKSQAHGSSKPYRNIYYPIENLPEGTMTRNSLNRYR